MVIVGAEGVVENGGIINKAGTMMLAAAARLFNKPFYVAAESYKFARWAPQRSGWTRGSLHLPPCWACWAAVSAVGGGWAIGRASYTSNGLRSDGYRSRLYGGHAHAATIV
jgi:hypothetical protein